MKAQKDKEASPYSEKSQKISELVEESNFVSIDQLISECDSDDWRIAYNKAHKIKATNQTIGFRRALAEFAREFFSKPQNYAYIIILCLLVIFIFRVQPLPQEVKERLITMLPPELELIQPEPEQKPEPPVEKKIEPPPVEKPVEKPKQEPPKPEEQKLQAVESEEVAPDLPSAFGDTSKEEMPSSLADLGRVFEEKDLDEVPKVVFKVEPKYPELARRAGKEGLVILRILITKTGEVGKIVVVSAPEKLGFDDAAVEAVRQWRFKPPTVGGNPVDVWCTLPIKFKLE